MKFSIAALAFIAALESAEARISFGSCPDYQNVSDFDVEAYAGKWYDQANGGWMLYTAGARCITKEFGLRDDGNLDLSFRGLYGLWGYRSGDGALYQCDEGSADGWTCMATMGRSSKRSPFPIFATDYENYEIGYSCRSMLGMKYENFSIATREREMSDGVRTLVKEALKVKLPSWADNFDSYITWTGQDDDCEYSWNWN